jgi:hypothetical protein
LPGLLPDLLATTIRTVFHRFPVFRPGFAPAHFPAALKAGFAWQTGFVALELLEIGHAG